MEGANALLKNVVTAAQQYNSHKIERNLVCLQGQIDVSNADIYLFIYTIFQEDDTFS